MRKTLVWISLCSCLVVAIAAWAQAIRKPGLWEMTSNMTWQKSPMPPGITLPAGAPNPFGGGPHTSQVCLTQAMIDKYGAPMPQTRNDCQITNVVMKTSSMTADMVCTGKTAGKGTVESDWSTPNQATGKVHFAGTMGAGPNSMPVEWSIVSTSSYKGPDCGSVKPLPMPNN
jgi:hypothetical protein